jgi:hypothetical protein
MGSGCRFNPAHGRPPPVLWVSAPRAAKMETIATAKFVEKAAMDEIRYIG